MKQNSIETQFRGDQGEPAVQQLFTSSNMDNNMKGDVIIQTCVFLLLTIQGIEPANKTKSGAIYVNQAHQPLFNFKCFSC